MTTLFTRDPFEAAVFVRSGELAAFPTETVYGLGADATDERAVRKIFEAKERPPDNPLIVHLAADAPLSTVASEVPESARLLAERFIPGPLTLVLPRRKRIPAIVSGGLPTVGVRAPSHSFAQAFLKACGVPVAAPSANRSGRPSPTTWKAVAADLNGRIACILKGEATHVGLESTVVDCTNDPPLLLRPGSVTLESLLEVIPDIKPANPSSGSNRSSPGMRYRHYAPHARVVLVDVESERKQAARLQRAAYFGLEPPSEPDAYVLVETCPSLEAYANRLFDFFRRCDEAGVEVIYCGRVSTRGLGRALMDRLNRASQVISLNKS